MFTYEPKILSGTLIKQLCERCSGRTTEICRKIYEFLIHGPEKNENVIVVVNSQSMIQPYFNQISKVIQNSGINEIKFYHHSGTMVGAITNNTVKFFSMVDNGNNLRGLRYKEIYFDTPELNVFDQDFIYNILNGIRR